MFKIVFIGNSGVGKTSFIHRAATGQFGSGFKSTVGVDYRILEVGVGGVLGVLQLWDTAGQERFKSITRQYYRNADAVVVMYDVTSEQSFLCVLDWISSVKEAGSEDVLVVVAGNKMDLEECRQVDHTTALRMAESEGCVVREVSAATGGGVREMMEEIATILTGLTLPNSTSTTTTPSLALHHPFRSTHCCK